MEEDDQDLANPIQPPNKTLDSTTQRKHEAMLERLSNLHQSRLQQAISRKSHSNSTPSFESTKSFLTRFSDSKQSIETQLDRCRHISSDPHQKLHLKSDLEKISTSVSDLEKLVAENSYFLPSYEVRSSLKTISDLKEKLEIANSELLPKKKFSFKNKPSPTPTTAKTTMKKVEEKAPEITVSDSKPNYQVRDSPGFRNKEGAVLAKHFGNLEEGDFTLTDLTSCEIHLTGCFRALYIHRLKNCKVFGGPVFGSILIEQVEGCVFMLASHQIRIHHATETDFYLRVRSRPIIEDSNGVRFAPYLLVYQGIVQDLKRSSLEEETENWANVDDFKWLRAVQSPNWSVLPEEERLDTISISSLESTSNDSYDGC